jgi:adenylate cyclase
MTRFVLPAARSRGAAALLHGLAGALFGAVVAHAPLLRDLVEPVELATNDWRVRSAAEPVPPPDEPVLVLFDEAAVADWPYLSPTPRGRLAHLVEVLAAAGARTIAVDVFLDRLYPELDRLGDSDERLRDAIVGAGNVVLVAHAVVEDGRPVIRPPHPFFGSAAAGVALADLPVPHETVREALLLSMTSSGPAAGLGLALYARHAGSDLDSLLNAAVAKRRLELPGVPPGLSAIDRHGRVVVPLRFRGPPSRPDLGGGAFRAFSAAKIAEYGTELPREWLSGRTIIVGGGFHPEDRYRTPFFEHVDASGSPAGWTYGAELHATAFHGLLVGTPRPLSAGVGAVGLFLLCLVAAAGARLLGPGIGTAIAGLWFLALCVAAWVLFAREALVVPIAVPGLALVFTVGLTNAHAALSDGREKRRIRMAFSKYVAPEVVAELVADPSRLRLGGERREITILFADLAGFTSLAAAVPAERVVSLLNVYLDAMAAIVIEHGGTVDKFIGDAVMALFGAPRPQVDHAARACRAALAMNARLQQLNHELQPDGWPELRMRIGIHTGNPIVGNIGGRDRFDYTALGDPVNVASRLESACRAYGVPVLISQATASAGGAAVRARELDVVGVYGRQEPVTIYELLDPSDAASRSGGLAAFAEALHAYRRGEFNAAEAGFLEAQRLLGEDEPASLYLGRIAHLKTAPPPEGWNPITRLQTK